MSADMHGSPNSLPSAVSSFRDLAEVLAENFKANVTLEEKPRSQVIVVLGSSASDIPKLPSWTDVLKQKILDQVGGIFWDDEIFLREICRVFSSKFGHYLWRDQARDAMREAILSEARVEQISNVACQMLGHADVKVRELISEEYQAMGDTEEGPPPHLTYELLAHLVMHGFVNHVVTMNFDEMLDTALENELGPRGFQRIITGHEPFEDGEANVPKLFKVHGTASSPESLRFTYTEVSVLTSAQAKHFKLLLEDASRADCHCLNLVSFGYSWQDPDLAHWVLAHLDRFHRIFIVRRENRLPEFFSSQDISQFRVLPLDDLCGGKGKAVPSSMFWWCLVDEVWRLLAGRPLIPYSRHLLLGNLLAPDRVSNLHMPLARRVRIEILLHLLKSKGMINTFGAPDSPRIRSYFSRLRHVPQIRVTGRYFLSALGLSEFMKRSPEPEARDTFFSTADSLEGLVEDVTTAFALEAPDTIERPVLENDLLTIKKVETVEFVREQVRAIAAAPEVEITKEINVKLYSVFSRPIPILSFAQFAEAISDTLSFPWTHLLAIVESKRWLTYPWSKDFFDGTQARRILMILPSPEGLAGWRVGADLRRREEEIIVQDKLFEMEIPWWRHNQHMFLPVQVDPAVTRLGPGVFFLREHKSPAIAPVLLKEPRDQAKLLTTFMLYTQRSADQKCASTGSGRRFPKPGSHQRGGLTKELGFLVKQLLAKGGIDSDMKELVEKAFASTAGRP